MDVLGENIVAPVFVHRFFAGPLWAGASVTVSSCGATATGVPQLSIRSAANAGSLTNPRPGAAKCLRCVGPGIWPCCVRCARYVLAPRLPALPGCSLSAGCSCSCRYAAGDCVGGEGFTDTFSVTANTWYYFLVTSADADNVADLQLSVTGGAQAAGSLCRHTSSHHSPHKKNAPRLACCLAVPTAAVLATTNRYCTYCSATGVRTICVADGGRAATTVLRNQTTLLRTCSQLGPRNGKDGKCPKAITAGGAPAALKFKETAVPTDCSETCSAGARRGLVDGWVGPALPQAPL